MPPSRRRLADRERLTRIFAAAGAPHGFTDVTAEPAAFLSAKLNWQRGMTWIHFRVSDYLCELPDAALSGLACSLFARITGEPTAG